MKHKLEDRFTSANLYYHNNSSNQEQNNDKNIQLNPKHSKPLQFWFSNSKGYDIYDYAYLYQLNNLKQKQLNSYVQSANDLLQITDKELKIVPFNENDNKIALVMVDNKTSKQINVTSTLTWRELSPLSHGECELLRILFWTVALNEHPHSFIFLHNPETHLHLCWQENLISTLVKLNPNAQFFIKTHSPAIIMNGWNDVYVDMKDIIV